MVARGRALRPSFAAPSRRTLAELALLAGPAIVLIVAVATVAHTVAEASGQPPFGDWRNYRDSVARVVSGGDLYEAKQIIGPYLMPDTAEFGYSYSPASIVWLVPFMLPGLSSAVWTAVTVGFFLAGLWAILRRDLGGRPVGPFALVLASFVPFIPFHGAVVSSNVNLFFVATYAWCWALGRREPRVGALAAAGALFKLFPSVMVLWPTGAARWRSMLIAAAVVIASSLVSLPLVGLHSFAEFPSVILNAQPYCVDVRMSIPCALAPAIGPIAGKAVAIGLAVAALAVALIIRNDRAAFVLFGVAMVAPVADLHLSYWLFPYVAILVLLTGLARRRRARVGAD